MKYVKLGIIISLILLTGCNNNTNKENIKSENFFKEELKEVYLLYEKDKDVPDVINEELVKNSIDTFLKNIEYSKFEIEYGETVQGIVRDNDERVAALKIPVKLSFEADEANIKCFLNNIIDFENRVIIGDIFVNPIEEKYKVSATFSFCGALNESDINDKKDEIKLNIQEIEGNKIESNKIILRDSDFIMVLRPYNSDSAKISLGMRDDISGESYAFYNVNSNVSIDMSINIENNEYYCEYSDFDGKKIKNKFIPKSSEILIDVLSCDKSSNQDFVAVNFGIVNNTEKKVNVKVFDDEKDRVNIKCTGNVEVID